ncbi:hypothetical protein ABW21_db0200471 [Orbilia brochopaga]|nr:hypothetical protein ABW21_db0200471 [Drechslerella brochopaga]
MSRQRDILTDEQAKTDIHEVLCTKIHKITRLFFRQIPWQSFTPFLNHGPLGDEVCRTFILPWKPHMNWQLVQDSPQMTTHSFVDALLASTIVDVMFRDPFFRWQTSIGHELHDIYFRAMEKDIGNAVAWKAETIKLYNSLSDSSQGLGKFNTRLQQLREFLYRALVYMVETHYQISEVKSLALDQSLIDLLESSAALADKWHECQFHLCIIDFDWLEEEQMDWQSPTASNYMTAFPRDEDFDDPQKQYKIIAVKSPGFIRYEGISAGEPLQEIVWEKASVLLTEIPVNAPAPPGNFPG